LGRLRDLYGGGGGFNPLPWIAGIVTVLLLFNSFKLVDERERGVVLRFGEFARIMQPGANFKWPWPIERVFIVQTTSNRSITDRMPALTRDENIVDVQYNVQYEVVDPNLYLFGSRSPDVLVQQATESVVRDVVGNTDLDDVIGTRERLAAAAKERIQPVLDSYRTGLRLTQLSLPDARPPDEVKDAFDDVIRASQDRDTSQRAATAYANQVIPEARGEAARIRTEAQGYRDASIARATGEAARFGLLVEQYRRAPEVTRRRLYLETMQQVVGNSQRVIAGRDNILYLPLNGAAASPAAPVAQAAAARLPATTAAPPADPLDDGRRARGAGQDEGR
jgi:membrane protease subunit HflK